MTRAVLVSICILFASRAITLEDGVKVEEPVVGADGIVTYMVASPYQRGRNTVEVLLPDSLEQGKRYPAVYILPVNDGTTGPWGSGIQEAKRHDIANRYGVICVAPAYGETPWFGDHPTDPAFRQESYLLKVVIPLIEERYSTIGAKEGRYLLGFSKSGFGAVTIFLRHLDFIGKAAAWDAPLTSPVIMKSEDEMLANFGTDENYRAYYIPGLIEQHADELKRGGPRLVLVSNGNTTGSITDVHKQLDSLGIPHRYLVDEKRKHEWPSGWFPVVAKLLFEDAEGGSGR